MPSVSILTIRTVWCIIGSMKEIFCETQACDSYEEAVRDFVEFRGHVVRLRGVAEGLKESFDEVTEGMAQAHESLAGRVDISLEEDLEALARMDDADAPSIEGTTSELASEMRASIDGLSAQREAALDARLEALSDRPKLCGMLGRCAFACEASRTAENS